MPTARAMASTKAMISCTVMATSPIVTLDDGPKKAMLRRASRSPHTQFTMPMMKTNNTIGTKSLVISDVPSSSRMIRRSTTIPNNGASTRTTIASASGAGHVPPQPSSNRSCQ